MSFDGNIKTIKKFALQISNDKNKDFILTSIEGTRIIFLVQSDIHYWFPLLIMVAQESKCQPPLCAIIQWKFQLEMGISTEPCSLKKHKFLRTVKSNKEKLAIDIQYI
jgi:hypothetical protein